MHAVLADSNTSAWTFGSSMITFVFPIILFIVVAAALFVIYTKPDAQTGQRKPGQRQSGQRQQTPGAGK